MVGAVHCEIFEAFKPCKFFKIGVSYVAAEKNLQIFSDDEFLRLGEENEPISLEKIHQ
jgi:hypothetical protein